jgi:hypothetical protein
MRFQILQAFGVLGSQSLLTALTSRDRKILR